ncbi:unnamed protein product, partial [Mesorhabditis spiculigera]
MMNRLVLCMLVSSTVLVSAAPTVEKATARQLQSLKANAVRPTNQETKRKRVKRAVIIEEVPIEDDRAELDGDLEAQLAGLSNDDLELLGEYVQHQLDAYNAPVEDEGYEVVRVPGGMLVPVEEWAVEGDDDEDEIVEPFPRDRRAIPVEVDDDQELPLEPQIVLVDENAVEEALENAQRDEIELRERIAELADLLNERAFRGL